MVWRWRQARVLAKCVEFVRVGQEVDRATRAAPSRARGRGRPVEQGEAALSDPKERPPLELGLFSTRQTQTQLTNAVEGHNIVWIVDRRDSVSLAELPKVSHTMSQTARTARSRVRHESARAHDGPVQRHEERRGVAMGATRTPSHSACGRERQRAGPVRCPLRAGYGFASDCNPNATQMGCKRRYRRTQGVTRGRQTPSSETQNATNRHRAKPPSQDLGSCARKGVWVQLPPGAPAGQA